jgi:hypothetical protein
MERLTARTVLRQVSARLRCAPGKVSRAKAAIVPAVKLSRRQVPIGIPTRSIRTDQIIGTEELAWVDARIRASAGMIQKIVGFSRPR